MSDLKSKLPDFNEISSMAGKLFKDVKKSVTEIVCDYKKKRTESCASEKTKPAKETVAETPAAKAKKPRASKADKE